MTERSNKPERRAANRIPVSVQAVLYYNSLMLAECQVRDLSAEGAFVDTGGHFLPDQAQVDLAFSLTAVDGVPLRFAVQVMRCTEQGVGVRLRHADSGPLRNLIEVLYAA